MHKPGAHIKAEALTHQYRRSASPALEGVDIEIQPCESVALIGRSGCGKSTLLHVLAGLIAPSHGSVHIDGARVHGPSPRWIVMFQQASLYPWMTVAQNVGLGLRFAGRKNEIAARVPQLLELVELEQYAGANVQDLSGGQQQRVALARSLTVQPEVLLLDEPFSALDTFTRSALQRDIRRIAKDVGITLVTVTHDINEAILMADRVVVMASHPGRIVSEIPVDIDEYDRMSGSERMRAKRDELARLFGDAAGKQWHGSQEAELIPLAKAI